MAALQEIAPSAGPGLRAGTLGLGAVLMQGITHIAPAVGLVLSIQITATYAGAAAPLAYGLAFLIVLLLGLSLTQLARHLPSAGGYFTYISRTVHPTAGFLTAWVYFLYDPTSTAINLAYLGHILQELCRARWGVWCPWWAVFLAGLLLITVLVYRGIEISSRVMAGLALFEIAVVVGLSAWALWDPGPSPPGAQPLAAFLPGSAPSPAGLALGVVFSLFCFSGFESVAPLAEESREPRRNLPRAILISIGLMGAFYLFCSYAALRGYGESRLADFVRPSENPLFTIAQRLWGRAWVLVLLAVLNSVLGVCIACTNAATRVFYAMGRAGSLPAVLARTHPRFRTPTGAIALQTAISLVVGLGLSAWLGPKDAFLFMGVVITLGLVLVYSAGNLGVMRLYLYPGERRAEFSWILHGLCPVGSTVALVYMGYRSLRPWPDPPLHLAPWVVVVWLGLGVALSLWRRQRASR